MVSKPAPIDVAVGILVKSGGEVLMTQRPSGKPYAGYWEFPGGKVELGESIISALVREFQEELGVVIQREHVQPWCGCEYIYPHAHVRLHFYLCRRWQGEPRALEGQQLAWQCGEIEVGPLLPATIPLVKELASAILEMAVSPTVTSATCHLLGHAARSLDLQ